MLVPRGLTNLSTADIVSHFDLQGNRVLWEYGAHVLGNRYDICIYGGTHIVSMDRYCWLELGGEAEDVVFHFSANHGIL